MSTRSSQRSVVNTKYGDRPIIELPVLGEGGIGTNYQYVLPVTPRNVLPQYTNRNVDYNNIQTAQTGERQHNQYVSQLQETSAHLRPLSKSNLIPNTHYPNDNNLVFYGLNMTAPQLLTYQQPMPYSQPIPYSQPTPYSPMISTQAPFNQEIHHYYGPNNEPLPGPPRLKNKYRYITDFTLEGTLEYGTMVSVKIKKGNISVREIPEFILRHLRETFLNIPKRKIVIVAERENYSIYS